MIKSLILINNINLSFFSKTRSLFFDSVKVQSNLAKTSLFVKRDLDLDSLASYRADDDR